MVTLVTEDDSDKQRLDQWLAARLASDLSRSRIQALIRAGQVAVDGVEISEPRFRLRAGQVVTLEIPPATEAVPAAENIPLDILYEDGDVIIINKPAGLVVHPGNGNWDGTLVNALIYHCGDSLSGIGGVRRPGIVHRLDKDTTGVMVAAKNDRAHRHLSAQFADHGRTGVLQRAYKALVWGVPERAKGTIELALGRAARDRTRQAVVHPERADARHAVTRYTVLEKFGPRDDATALASLLECRLETGRTHQIRVHMAHIGHPLIGDQDYGSAFKTKANRLDEPARGIVQAFPRQALHAWLLTFAHPVSDEVMTFTADLPDDMQKLVDCLR
ncbi:MAG: Pseudouridine synthase [Candidatus Tokpelaia hoelldobleri]|uniref:Pseudouridine synthase n=1 Tax=Candidatus Tokpelaia hoelldobleri TaxID=1902579 RepID=A0A1U9JSU9_9HYPH|nr:MAG: Pseudouridine synthase [Candidatus Tokpelaia hoelldoblerii]